MKEGKVPGALQVQPFKNIERRLIKHLSIHARDFRVQTQGTSNLLNTKVKSQAISLVRSHDLVK